MMSVHVRRLEGPGPGGEGEAGDEERDDEGIDEPVVTIHYVLHFYGK